MVTLKKLSIAVVLGAVSGQAMADRDDGSPIPAELALITQPGVTLEDVQAAHPNLLLIPLRQYTPARIHLLQVPEEQMDAYESELSADKVLIKAAEQNKTVSTPEHGTTQSLFLRAAAEAYIGQIAIQDIRSPGMLRGGAAGALVAVLDTGIASHPELDGRIEQAGYNYITDSYITDESDCEAGTGLIGHGTYVAGLIALTDKNCRVLPVVVLDCQGVGNAFAVACGIYHAIDAGANVINMSFATTIENPIVEQAINDADRAGIICVASVSNGGRDTALVRSFPADYDNVIGVGGLTHDGEGWARAPFSDWGRSVTMAAPAVDVYSLWYDGSTFGYAKGSGTSYSAAFVSGVTALMFEKYGVKTSEWVQSHYCDTAQTVAIESGIGLGCNHKADGMASLIDARHALCTADFNGDNKLTRRDYTAYLAAFEAGDAAADYNGDGAIDFFDYDQFVEDFEMGC